MFSKLLKRKQSITAPADPAVPTGTVVWAIGDIHGRLDLLVPLVDAIREDLRGAIATRKLVIFLGDYIDRGPHSRGVLEYLAELEPVDGIEWRFLKGNHEQTMIEFLDDPSVGVKWCEYGGDATLRSFGLRPPALKHRTEGWTHLSADLNYKVSSKMRAFLDAQELSITVGDYFFAHAGARPGELLDRQSAEDLLWIRRSFLDSSTEFDRIVVHGHTPTAEVYADQRRVGIDTKAYESGILTALRLSGRERSVMQTIAPSDNSGAQPEDILVRTAHLSAPSE
ncbi:metallophosphoesterase family protein [Brevundimonas sp. Root1423]|uniref:metallophosphoesterase family protein n=1 Tax=Brevundimonas sp. Root1423 TaxID=1736462 RepID=UPI000B2D3272|nr:metallophosphoesterase family protein [Brevundimonas sp. Root1423]